MALREQGRSFAAIARTLGLKRAADARQAFLRELRSRPDEERQGSSSVNWNASTSSKRASGPATPTSRTNSKLASARWPR